MATKNKVNSFIAPGGLAALDVVGTAIGAFWQSLEQSKEALRPLLLLARADLLRVDLREHLERELARRRLLLLKMVIKSMEEIDPEDQRLGGLRRQLDVTPSGDELIAAALADLERGPIQ